MNAKKFPALMLTASLILLPAAGWSQSLWHDDVSQSMFADKRGAGIGDILTVVVQENTTANQAMLQSEKWTPPLTTIYDGVFTNYASEDIAGGSGDINPGGFGMRSDSEGGSEMSQADFDNIGDYLLYLMLLAEGQIQ